MQVGFHEFLLERCSSLRGQNYTTYVEIDLVKVAVRLKDDVHVIEACNLESFT